MSIAISISNSVKGSLVPGGGGVPFVNEYSMTFDGSFDYVDVGNPASLQITGAITLSAWIKTTDTSAYEFIIGKDNVANGTRSYSLMRNGSIARFNIYQSNVAVFIEGTTTINDGFWHHISDLKIYVDGVLDGTNVGGGGTMDNGTFDFEIGRRGGTSAQRGYWTGNIDSVAVWNSDQSANINSIYSASGVPDISSLNPLSWWRMGDGDSFSNPGGVGDWTFFDNGSGGNDATSTTLPESARLPITANSYSQNSFVFDGIDDFVTLGNSSNLNVTGDQSVSCWIKFNSNTGTSYVINVKDIFGVYTSGGRIQGFSRINGSFNNLPSSGTNYNDNQWHHVVFLKDANDLTLYIDGVFESELLTAGGTSLGTTNDARLGARYTNASYYTGASDEIAIFDYKLTPTQITQIFNNGVPTDISSLNPLGHWRMGESATWNGSQWTLTDQGSGGNDGTSTTLPESAKTGDQPYVI
jgi:hypothetical protein